MAAYNQFLSEFLKAQDEREFALGDTLDIKTSIALVIITFLATQSAEFMKHPLSPFWQLVQHISIPFIVVAGLLALIELIPRNYRLRTASDEFVKWAEETRRFYADQGETDPEHKAIERINETELHKLRNRFRVNMSINEGKSKLMSVSFYCIFVAVCCNLGTLTALAFQ
jgi:hypothetical protein